MPVISSSKINEGISPNVQSANITSSGGVVEKAVANLGQKSVQFGAELLRRRKVAEAKKYADDSVRDKRFSSDTFFRGLRDSTDPSTGKMPDGRDFTEHYSETEDKLTESISEKAPTEMARQMFLDRERNYTTERIVKADRDKHLRIARSGLRTEVEDVDTITKFLQDYNPESETDDTVTKRTLREIEERDKSVVSAIGSYHTPESMVIARKQYSNKMAVGGVENMFTHEKLGEIPAAIGMFSLMKDRSYTKGLEDTARQAGLLEKSDSITISLRGRLLKFDRKSRKFHDLETGASVDQSETFNQTTADGDVVNVGVERADSDIPSLVPYLTPDDQRRMTRRLMGALSRKKKQNNSAMTNKTRNMSTRLENTETNNKMRAYTGTNEEKEYLGHINDIGNSDIDPVQKENQIGLLVSSKVLGEFKDSNNFQNRSSARKSINNIPVLIRDEVTRLGIPLEESSLGRIIKQATKSATSDFNQETQALFNNTASYHIDKDPSFAKKYNEMDSSMSGPIDPRNGLADKAKIESTLSSVRASSSNMGLPEQVTENGLLPTGMASTKANGLLNAIEKGNKTGDYSEAVNWIRYNTTAYGKYYPVLLKQLGKYGVPEEVQHVALLDNTPEGQKLAERVMKNIFLGPEIRKNYTDSGKDLKELTANVFKETAAFRASIILGDPNQLAALKKANAYLDMSVSEAAVLGTNKDKHSNTSDTSKQAVQTIIKDHITTINHGDSLLSIPNSIMKSAGVDKALVEKAVSAFSNETIMQKYVDVEASLPTLVTKTLDTLKLTGKERKDEAYKIAKSNGTFRVTSEGGKLAIVYGHTKTNNNIPMGKKPSKVFSIPLDQLRLNPDVQSVGGTQVFLDSFFDVGTE